MNIKDCFGYKKIFIGFNCDKEHKAKIARCCVNKEKVFKEWDYEDFLKGDVSVLEEFKSVVNNKVKEYNHYYVLSKDCPLHCPFPKWEDIEMFQVSLFTGCNAKCKFCFRGDNFDKNLYAKEKKVYLKTISELKGQGKAIHLTDEGEPFLLLKEMKEWFKGLKEGDFTYVMVTTNAILIDDEMIDILKNCKVKVEIHISLNAPTREIYKDLIGVDAFDKVVSNINKICDAGIKCSANIVYCNDLIGHLAEFEGLVKCTIQILVDRGKQELLNQEEYKEFVNKKGWNWH